MLLKYLFLFIIPLNVNVRGTIHDKCSNGKNKSITLKARLWTGE